ncbi:hypothetical protein VB005_04120 [Metarhizium brunneum]
MSEELRLYIRVLPRGFVVFVVGPARLSGQSITISERHSFPLKVIHGLRNYLRTRVLK